MLRATVQTVARARHLPHGNHRRARAAGPVTLTQITSPTTGQAAYAPYPPDAAPFARREIVSAGAEVWHWWTAWNSAA